MKVVYQQVSYLVKKSNKIPNGVPHIYFNFIK